MADEEIKKTKAAAPAAAEEEAPAAATATVTITDGDEELEHELPPDEAAQAAQRAQAAVIDPAFAEAGHHSTFTTPTDEEAAEAAEEDKAEYAKRTG